MIRIHSSIHKCLTTYYMRVMSTLYNRFRPGERRFCHYGSSEGLFYNNLHRHKIVSANNFAVNFAWLDDDFRIVRFIRDPRDLVVSGYFYHRRGAEPWFRTVTPTPRYWEPINGNVPADMPHGLSYAQFLQRLSLEQGLIREIEFRKHHFEALRQWPIDERIRVFSYENILGNEADVFREIFRFYELPWQEQWLATWLANRYSARRRAHDRHVRNVEPGQWRTSFTRAVHTYFDRHYGDLVELLGYERAA